MPRLLLVSAGLLSIAVASSAADWPQWMGPQRDGIWNETGIRKDFKKGKPKERWRVSVGGGYAGPAVANGRVYIADKMLHPGAVAPNDPFAPVKLAATERVLCLDSKSGKELWKHEYNVQYAVQYPCGPRCAPLVHDGKVYSLGAMGHLCCLDAEKSVKGKGQLLWSREFPAAYGVPVPIWGFAGHPIIYKDLLICLVGGRPGTNEGSVIAFDKNTGQLRWRAIDCDSPGYNSPVLIESAGATQLVVWTPKKLQAIDPATGKKFWSVPLEPKHGMSIMSPRKHGDCVFAAGIGNVGVTVKLDPKDPTKVAEVWRGKGGPTAKDGVYPVNMTPFVEAGVIYAADQPGMFRAVDLKTGRRLWESFEPIFGKNVPPGFTAPCGTAFVVKNSANGRFYTFSETGDLAIGKFTPEGYTEAGRMHLLDPTCTALNGRKAVWSHPAFAEGCIFARNDKQAICVPLGE
ncbi:MAG TPA: PQQ-binding-like beta-propeller repeat protein [Gemmataceae bacterium]|jgi:outer membrane protein assembly factor BamB